MNLKVAVSDQDDGYKYYRRLAQVAPLLLRSNGAVVMEVGAGQAERVEHLFRESGFTNLHVANDLQDIQRIVVGMWRSERSG